MICCKILERFHHIIDLQQRQIGGFSGEIFSDAQRAASGGGSGIKKIVRIKILSGKGKKEFVFSVEARVAEKSGTFRKRTQISDPFSSGRLSELCRSESCFQHDRNYNSLLKVKTLRTMSSRNITRIC